MILLFCFCFIDITSRKRSTYRSLGSAIASKLEDWRYCKLFLLLLSIMSTPTSFALFCMFSLPMKKKEAIYFLIVSFIYKEQGEIFLKREEEWKLSSFAFFLIFTLFNFHFWILKLKLWLVIGMVKYKYTIKTLWLIHLRLTRIISRE